MRIFPQCVAITAFGSLLLVAFVLGYRQMVFARYRPNIEEIASSSGSVHSGGRTYRSCMVRELAPRLITRLVDEPAQALEQAHAKTPVGSQAHVPSWRQDFDKKSVVGWHLRAEIWALLLRSDYSDQQLANLYGALVWDGHCPAPSP